MERTIESKAKLNNGVEMPWLGLGVWRTSPGRETRDAVRWALETGYRHIDTAHMYGNEKDVGAAIKDSGVPRKEVFVTTKLWNDDHGYDKARKAFEKSRKALGLDQIDLYLIHWPVSSLRGESWKALEKIYKDGQCRAIGVSNYTVQHLDEVLASAKVPPAVNQVEFHPFLYQKELLDYCRKHRIQLEAYSPLTRGNRLRDATISGIAKKLGKTPAQILIRWALEHDLVVIPKSANRDRIRENAAVFDFSLSAADVEALDALSANLHVAWDPTDQA
jgi:diketogulonate reductase-like aldo/keto reductase